MPTEVLSKARATIHDEGQSTKKATAPLRPGIYSQDGLSTNNEASCVQMLHNTPFPDSDCRRLGVGDTLPANTEIGVPRIVLFTQDIVDVFEHLFKHSWNLSETSKKRHYGKWRSRLAQPRLSPPL